MASPAAPACPTASPRSAPSMASTTTRSCPPPAPSARCGSAPTTSSAICWAAWSTRIPGSPAAITAFPTAKIPTKPESPLPARRRTPRAPCATNAAWARRRSSWPAASGSCAEWEDWIDNPELGPMAFQFGTRPLLTQESPISDAWKRRLLTLKEGDVFLNRFSPTGFYSSAVNNPFIQELRERSERQVAYSQAPVGEHVWPFPRGRARPPGLSHGGRPAAGARSGSPRASPRRCARRNRR